MRASKVKLNGYAVEFARKGGKARAANMTPKQRSDAARKASLARWNKKDIGMKLSKKQQEIVDRMKSGWELGSSMTMDGRCWIQEGGCGRGGPSETVSNATVSALFNRAVIRVKESKFPLRTYELA